MKNKKILFVLGGLLAVCGVAKLAYNKGKKAGEMALAESICEQMEELQDELSVLQNNMEGWEDWYDED